MKSFIIITAFIFSTLYSCKKENATQTSSSEYLIFGHFYGECMGEKCIEIYKLDKTQLYEDTKDIYPSAMKYYSGSYNLLSQQKFDQSKDLLSFFPNDLLTESNTVIGQPDAADGGGLYIEYNYNGVRKFWLIDQMKSNVPSKYHSFIDEVNKRIKLNE